MKPPVPDSLAASVFRKALQASVDMPEGLRRRIFGEPPRNDRGAPLDEQLHVMLQVLEAIGSPEPEELGAVQTREVYHRSNRLFDIESVDVDTVQDFEIPGPESSMPARLYRPGPDAESALLFFHGGGFVIGTIEGYDRLCRLLAKRSGRVVISVDYRLAPEHPFPAAVDDTQAAFEWLYENAGDFGLDPRQIAVGGDSAGGNLATVVCQQQHSQGRPLPERQLLLYPSVDEHDDYPSYRLFADGFFLTRSMIKWFSNCYLGDVDISDPRVSPLCYEELGGLPPAMIVTAGFDPLRDEGEAYAKRLEEAGVPVVHRCFDQLVHGFVTMGGIVDAAGRAVADIGEEFGRQPQVV